MLKLLYGFGATAVIAGFLCAGSFRPLRCFSTGLGYLSWQSVLCRRADIKAMGYMVFWTKGLGTPLPPVQPTRQVMAGSYRFSRNPLYLGILLMLSGTALLFHSLVGLVLLVPLWVLCEWGIRREEKNLQKRFWGRVPALSQSCAAMALNWEYHRLYQPVDNQP